MRSHLSVVFIVAILIPPMASARGDDIPTLDVRPVCRGIASQSADPGIGQGGQAETYQRCLESEKSVREQIKNEWPAFSAGDKRHCVTLAKTGGESSNTELLTCLEMSRDVRALRTAAATASREDLNKPATSLSMPTVEPAPAEPALPPTATKESSKSEADTAKKEIDRAKADAQAAAASEANAQRKLADVEAALRVAKEETERARAEAERAKADAKAARDSEAAAIHKLADAEAAQAANEKSCRPGIGGRLLQWLKGSNSNNH